MDQYIDKTFSILDGSLICCRNEDRTLVIPAEVNGHAIRRIGKGCSIGGATDTLIISEGIEEIGEEAFINSPYLKRIELPESLRLIETYGVVGTPWQMNNNNYDAELYLKRRLSKTDFEWLDTNSIPIQTGEKLLSGNYIDLPEFKDVLGNFGRERPPVCLSKEMGRLFSYNKGEVLEEILFDGKESAGNFKEPVSRGNLRDRMVPILLRDPVPAFWDNDSEIRSDLTVQKGERVLNSNTILTFYRPEDVQEQGDEVLIRFHVRFLYAFFIALVPVYDHGTIAYLPRDIFLNGDKKHPLMREDYDDVIRDSNGKRLRRSARYRFLSMLS